MAKPSSRPPAIPYIGGTLIWAYMSILSHTLRWRVEGLEHIQPYWEDHKPFLLPAWHSRLLLMPYIQIIKRPQWRKRPTPITLMVSASRDGEFTNRAGKWLGLGIIRGSAPTKGKGKMQGKRGVDAAREALRVMSKGGAIVVTIDGPRGPAEEVGVGAVKLAQQMGAPIIVYGLSAHAKRMKSWDRLLMPKPFARGAVVFGKPIPTSKDMDPEVLRQQVERELRAATARADELAGQTDTALPVWQPPAAVAPVKPAPNPDAVGSAALERSGS